MCLSSTHSKSEINKKHAAFSFSVCEPRHVKCFNGRTDERFCQINGSKLTNSVKIRRDHCYSNTIDAIQNFTQHFMDALLSRTDCIVA